MHHLKDVMYYIAFGILNQHDKLTLHLGQNHLISSILCICALKINDNPLFVKGKALIKLQLFLELRQYSALVTGFNDFTLES